MENEIKKHEFTNEDIKWEKFTAISICPQIRINLEKSEAFDRLMDTVNDYLLWTMRKFIKQDDK